MCVLITIQSTLQVTVPMYLEHLVDSWNASIPSSTHPSKGREMHRLSRHIIWRVAGYASHLSLETLNFTNLGCTNRA